MIGIGLAMGEYEVPAKKEWERNSKYAAHLVFLYASFALLGPEKLESLISIGSLLDSVQESPWNDLSEFNRVSSIISEPVKAWCSNFCLEDPWCHDYAQMFVLHSRYPGYHMLLERLAPLVRHTKLAQALPEQELTMNFGNWDVIETTRSEFMHSARARFEALLSEYCSRKEAQAQAAGLVKVPTRRNIETFFWLAGYQVLSWPIESIAEAEKRKRPTVGKQIHQLASEIGLNMRNQNQYDSRQTAEAIRQTLRMARTRLKEANPGPL